MRIILRMMITTKRLTNGIVFGKRGILVFIYLVDFNFFVLVFWFFKHLSFCCRTESEFDGLNNYKIDNLKSGYIF